MVPPRWGALMRWRRLAVDLAGQPAVHAGAKRGLAQRLAGDERRAANVVTDGMMVLVWMALMVAGLLWLVPGSWF